MPRFARCDFQFVSFYFPEKLTVATTPDAWKCLDDALARPGCASLSIEADFEGIESRTDVSEITCVDKFNSTMFPKASARGALRIQCDSGDCVLHRR